MIGVIFGGNSLEHEVSIKSGKDILREFPGMEIYLDKEGSWFVDQKPVEDVISYLKKCDVVIPMIHGSPGEDGILQGFLELNQIPYVGSDVTSSAVCMDKDLTKRILQTHGIDVVPFTTYYSLKEALNAHISTPCVIKATSLGSTFGVHLVRENIKDPLEDVFSLGKKALVEEWIVGREIWCSVLQDEGKLLTSTPGEISPHFSHFTYESKYTEGGATYIIPPKNLPIDHIKEISKKAFKVLGCRGMARVDFFYSDDGRLLLNEVNTLPGFTRNSLFSKSFAHDGLSYKKVLEILFKNCKKELCFV
jgi:D-alanine-D-alanine ligase